MPANIVRRNGSAWRISGAALINVSSHGAATQPTAPSATDKPAAVRNDW